MKKMTMLVLVICCFTSAFAKKKPKDLVKWNWGYDTISAAVINDLFFFAENKLVITKNHQPVKVEKGENVKTNFKDMRIRVDVERMGKFAGRDTTYTMGIVKTMKWSNFTDQWYEATDSVRVIDHIRIWFSFLLKDSNETIYVPFYLNDQYYFSAESAYYEFGTNLKSPPKKANFYTIEGVSAIMVDGKTIPGLRETIDYKVK